MAQNNQLQIEAQRLKKNDQGLKEPNVTFPHVYVGTDTLETGCVLLHYRERISPQVQIKHN